MDSRRVAFVITGFGVGGAERQVIDLSRALSDRGVDVLVVTLIDPTEWGVASVGDAATVASLHMTRGRPDPRAILRLRRVLKSWHPDIVHAHMIHANLLTRFALTQTRWPLVNTIHNQREGGRVLDFVQARTRHIPDWTTLISKAAQRRHDRIGLVDTANSSVVYNGFSFTRLGGDTGRPRTPGVRDSTRSPFDWLAIGRLEPQKDYPNLIDAVAHLREVGYDIHVRIAGSGYLEADLRRQINRLKLESTIDLVGHVDDIVTILRSSDAVVNSSVLEGLPISLIEASALERPIVATDVGGTSEVVIADRTGILVNKEDFHDLASGMATLMDLPLEERRAMGHAGAAHARSNFDLNHIVEEWLQLYGRLAPSSHFEDIRSHQSRPGTTN